MSSITPKRYDAFLSYNFQDRPAVHEVTERLNGEGLKLYLEEWELAPGQVFQPALAVALHQSRTCVVFLGPNGLGPWQKQGAPGRHRQASATRRSMSSRCCYPALSGPGGGRGAETGTQQESRTSCVPVSSPRPCFKPASLFQARVPVSSPRPCFKPVPVSSPW